MYVNVCKETHHHVKKEPFLEVRENVLLLASTVIGMHDHVSDDDYNSTSNFGKLNILHHNGEEEEAR
jgi:hypothetical protein